MSHSVSSLVCACFLSPTYLPSWSIPSWVGNVATPMDGFRRGTLSLLHFYKRTADCDQLASTVIELGEDKQGVSRFLLFSGKFLIVSWTLLGMFLVPLGAPRLHLENVSVMGNLHPSPSVKTLCNLEPQNWPEIASRDAKSACFEGSRTSCDV